MVEFDFFQEEKNIYLSELSNMVKYLQKLILDKNVEYFIFWAKIVNFKKYKDQYVKCQILAEMQNLIRSNDFQGFKNYHI